MDRDGTRVRMVLGVLELRESRFRDTYRRVHVRVRSGTRYLRSADGYEAGKEKTSSGESALRWISVQITKITISRKEL